MILEWTLTLLTTFIIIMMHERVLVTITNKCRSIRMVWIMMILAMTHTVHIWVYAFAFYIGIEWFEIGDIRNCPCDHIHDYVYFSATNYTSLGYGDMIATEGVRLLATFEGLIGLLMIGWSTAFAFWWMQKHWLHIDSKG